MGRSGVIESGPWIQKQNRDIYVSLGKVQYIYECTNACKHHCKKIQTQISKPVHCVKVDDVQQSSLADDIEVTQNLGETYEQILVCLELMAVIHKEDT